MKKILLILSIIGVVVSCKKEVDNNIETNDQNFLIFGHFYGFCQGEHCVKNYKITDKKLYKVNFATRPGETTEFIELENEKFELVKDLVDFFPDQLRNENDLIIGCPDCTDGGGLRIQIFENDINKMWVIDQFKVNVPTYLHDFMDKVNDKIHLLRN